MCMRGIEDKPQHCLICGRPCHNRRSLGNHVARTHPEHKGLESYYLKYIAQTDSHPECLCGCSKNVSWNRVKYHFSEYITGHNPGGFSRDNQPTFTHEQIVNRNTRIKESVVSKKTVKERKRSSIVVTADISTVNVPTRYRHDHPKFTSHLRKMFGDDLLVDDHSITVRSLGIDIEFDDIHTHGFDRENCYSLDQLKNITNDIRKNLVSRRDGITVIRIRSDAPWEHAKTIKDLINCAYHVVKDGIVTHEGTFRLRDDEHTLIDKETLIRTNETELFPDALGRAYTSTEILPVVREFILAHVEYWGWFYQISEKSISDILEEVRQSMVSMSEKDEYLSRGTVGSTWLKSFSRSFWHVDKGPVAATLDPRKLDSVLKYRLGLNDSKLYHYRLSDGHEVDVKETFDINIRNIRFGLIVQRNSVSWFRPCTAADVYSRFIDPSIEHPVVWDPSGGFGARMLGFSAVNENGTYICNEPAEQTEYDLRLLADEIMTVKRGLMFNIAKCGSEEMIINEESLDLVFTSPPYFDREKYFNEDTQCWKRYPDPKSWYDSYLLPTFRTAYNGLKKGCRMVMNIDEKCSSSVLLAAKEVGFGLETILRLKTGRDHFNRKSGYVDSDRFEPVYVFIK